MHHHNGVLVHREDRPIGRKYRVGALVQPLLFLAVELTLRRVQKRIDAVAAVAREVTRSPTAVDVVVAAGITRRDPSELDDVEIATGDPAGAEDVVSRQRTLDDADPDRLQ